MGDDDPKSGIPENAISFEEAFEQVFDVACPDAKELRRALDAAGPTVPETYNEETWLAACEAWDIARHEVWEIFKSELVYFLDGTLIAYLEGERLKRGYWEAQEFSDNV